MNVQLTKEKYAELEKELSYRKGELAQELSSRVGEAAKEEHLKENVEFIVAMEKQALNEKRIKEIETLLKNSEIISVERRENIQIGITFEVAKEGEIRTFMLVSEVEANPKEGKISVQSPLGKAVLGKSVGEMVEVGQRGLQYEIIRIM